MFIISFILSIFLVCGTASMTDDFLKWLRDFIALTQGLKRSISSRCPLCNSDVPKVRHCFLCRKGTIKKRKLLWFRYKLYIGVRKW